MTSSFVNKLPALVKLCLIFISQQKPRSSRNTEVERESERASEQKGKKGIFYEPNLQPHNITHRRMMFASSALSRDVPVWLSEGVEAVCVSPFFPSFLHIALHISACLTNPIFIFSTTAITTRAREFRNEIFFLVKWQLYTRTNTLVWYPCVPYMSAKSFQPVQRHCDCGHKLCALRGRIFEESSSITATVSTRRAGSCGYSNALLRYQ